MCNLNIEFPHFYPRQRLSRPDKKFTADMIYGIPAGKDAVLIAKSRDSRVREGVAGNRRREGGLLNLHIEEGMRHQLYSWQIGFAGYRERSPSSNAYVSSEKGLLHRRIRPSSVCRTPSSTMASSPSFSKSIYPSMVLISSSSAPMRRRTI